LQLHLTFARHPPRANRVRRLRRIRRDRSLRVRGIVAWKSGRLPPRRGE
jgi:hypothetical protein